MKNESECPHWHHLVLNENADARKSHNSRRESNDQEDSDFCCGMFCISGGNRAIIRIFKVERQKYVSEVLKRVLN